MKHFKMLMTSQTARTILAVAISVAASSPLHAGEVKETFLSEGVTARVGGYRPIRAEMDQEADIVSKVPEDLQAPKFGQIEIGEQKWAFVLDEPEEADARLWIDTNGDGDLTNDPPTEWTARDRGGLTMYSGKGQIALDDERIGSLGLYRFDPADENRAALKNTLMYYLDFGSEFSFELDGQEHATFVSGKISEESALPIDRDGNGRVSRRFEMARVGEAFNFTGTSYVFELTDGRLQLRPADEKVDQLPLPPNLITGKPALSFTATTMDGATIEFPSAFQGQIVMLDFWATWCGPCIGEIPHMKEAYAEWHDKGFEILGVSFDREEMEDKVREFLAEKEITWPQIYEGKGWETSLGIMHDVSGIPFVLLVDGDSGEILATASDLRGPGLSEFIGKQLELKQAAQ
jgi:thiol-disulfide isomerase/thioredoxin